MNKQVKPVVIGTIGAGYAAHLHGNGYEKVSGVPIRLKTVYLFSQSSIFWG